MKSQYQQFRDILDAIRYPVDPGHEADFKAILLSQKKRRRRNVLWFFLYCGAMIVAGYGMVSFFSDTHFDEKLFDPESLSESSALPASPSQNNASISLQEDGESLSSENPDHSKQSERGNESISQSDAVANSIHASTNTPKSSSTNTFKSNPRHAQSNKKDAAGIQNSKASSTLEDANTSQLSERAAQHSGHSSSAISEQKEKSELTKYGKDTQDRKSELREITEESHDERLLNTPVATLSHEEVEISDDTPIIPSTRRIHLHKVHYGLSAAWFPTGNLLKKSTLKTGSGYQLGGYATYRMSPRTQFRADAGLAVLDGGFTYIKESSSQLYGFSVLNQNHTLDVEKLYSAYIATEMGLKRGKNLFCIGLLGQYVYGARGDIERREQGQIEAPDVNISDDVWLSTKDMNKFALQGTVGVRSHLSRRLQVAATVRVPIIHTLKSPKDSNEYTFQVKSHGISPQLSISYQINQQ